MNSIRVCAKQKESLENVGGKFIIHLPSFYLFYLGKNFTFTCLSYKFHMIGSGAAYQREEKAPDKGRAES